MTSNTLDMTSIELLQKELQEVFGSDAKLYARLKDKLGKSMSLTETLNVIPIDLTGGDSEVVGKGQLLVTLYSVSSQNLELSLYIWKKVTTLAETAEKYYELPADSPPFAKPEQNAYWKNRLFTLQPTGVLLGLIDKDKIAAADADTKALVITILSKAMQNGFQINKDSTRELLKGNEDLKKASPQIQESTSHFLYKVQRLHALVRDPADINLLIRKYDSARKIAGVTQTIFVEVMATTGMSAETAIRIHDHAQTVEIRNEQTWATALRELSEKKLPYVAVMGPRHQQDPVLPTGRENRINLTTLFRDLDSVECDDSTSVLSPAAYYVDLLNLLKESHATPSDTNTPTLFSLLVDRRPDLLKLELSGSNTNLTIPYIDLVNEVLESYVDYISGNDRDAIKSYNMPAEETSDTVNKYAAQPQHVNLSIYQKVLQPEVFPMTSFPYNQAIHTVREFLAAVGTTRMEVMSTFSADERLLGQIAKKKAYNDKALLRLRALVQSVNKRAIAAESLGMIQDDFIALTKESFQPAELWLARQKGGASVDNYRSSIGAKSPAALWGYCDEDGLSALQRMQDSFRGFGLAFIKSQLLPRADISFRSLFDILKTNFIGGRLIISSDGEDNNFSGKLDEMRLRSTLPDDGQFGKLNEDVCFDLQAFIRLWKKLKWSISETDAVLSTLQRCSEDSDWIAQEAGPGITVDILENIAAVKQVGELTGLSPSTIQPLWGDIHTNGPDSLYARLFLRPRLQSHDVFGANSAGLFFDPNESRDLLEEHKGVLLAALSVQEKDFSNFMEAANLTLASDLDLASVSKLYRHALFCKILSIPSIQYKDFRTLFNDEILFESPKATLSVLKRWNSILDAGWNLPDISAVLTKEDISHGDQALATTVKLMAGVKTINAAYSDAALEIGGPSETVQKISSLLFDSAKSANVARLVEGKSAAVEDVTLEKGLTALPGPVPVDISSKVSCYVTLDEPNKVRLTLNGLLSDSQKTLAIGLFKDSKAWKTALNTLCQTLQSTYQEVVSQVFQGAVKAEADKEFIESVGSNNEARRNIFLKYAIPMLKSRLMQQTILDSVSIDFAIEASLLVLLLTDVVQGASPSETAFETLKSLKLPRVDSDTFEGFFIPPSAGNYKFIVDTGTNAELSINGIQLPFQAGVEQLETVPLSLINGQMYSIKYTGKIGKELRFVTQDALAPSDIPLECLIEKATKETVEAIYARIRRASKVAQVYSLSVKELEFFSHSSEMFIDFDNITLKQLEQLQRYRAVRDACSQDQTKRPITLTELLGWAAKTKDYDSLYSKVHDATGWDSKQVDDLLKAKYPGKMADSLVKLFQNEAELFATMRMLAMYGRMQIPSLQMGTVFAISDYSEPSLVSMAKDVNFNSAAALNLALQSSPALEGNTDPISAAYGNLKEKQRTVLIQYLLNQKKVQALQIWDADNLFEYFLIDVQMGAKLKTSRMKQAISTIQLYVQRCMLGLEKFKQPKQPVKNEVELVEFAINCQAVAQVRWKYMAKYTLWEANRRLFLYPENYVDPTLRDNKSSLFQALESSLMQKNLTMETISDAIKGYIFGVNEISDLEVMSYILEQITDTTWKYHFFGRTRHAPYQFYYRVLDGVAGEGIDLGRWSAWSKIDVDVPVQTADINGDSLGESGSYLVPVLFKGRLFLFIPQFLSQTAQPSAGDQSMEDIAKAKGGSKGPSKFWEVRMGWTEYRNGKWSSKKVSDTFLEAKVSLGKDDYPGLSRPDISRFQFFATTSAATTGSDNGIIVVDVDTWYPAEESNETSQNCNAAAKAKRRPVGRFKFQGEKVTALSGIQTNTISAAEADTLALKRDKNDHTVPTYFMKVYATADPKDNPQPGDAPSLIPKGIKALDLTIRRHGEVQKIDHAKTLTPSLVLERFTWSMSLDYSTWTSTLSARVLSIASNKAQQTYFSYPANTPTLIQFNNVISNQLMEESSGFQDARSVYSYLSKVSDDNLQKVIFGGLAQGFHEQAAPYSLYTWELGMHVVSLVMERLLATQQYELALDIAKLVFDPTVDGKDLSRCWRFVPFQNAALANEQSAVDILKQLEAHQDKVTRNAEKSILDWKNKPFEPHAVARGRPSVYMKRFVTKYIEILIASGDEYFRQNSLESIPLAIQRYVEASHLFGPAPQQVPKLGKLAVKTYSDLEAHINLFSNATVEMELDFPYTSDPRYRGAAPLTKENAPKNGTTCPLLGFVKTGYFGVPPNYKLTELRNLIDDRFYKIRNSLDINGNQLSLALFDPPLDPGVLAQAQAANLSISTLLNDLDAPMPNYRFIFLLQKAIDMCMELKSMGDSFLQAKEKRDAEALTLLLSQHDILVQTTALPLKELQKTEALRTVTSLEETRKSHVMRLRYYLSLTGDSKDKIPGEDTEWMEIEQSIGKPSADDLRMSSYEKEEMDKADSSADLTEKASILELVAAGLMAIPNLTSNMQPMGVGVGIKMDAENIAKFMTGTATFMKLKAEIDTHDSQRAGRKGGMLRQLQDRRLQANIAGYDIKQVDRQIAVQKIRLAMCDSEIKNQREQIERSNAVQSWHRTKYTNEKLYAWLENTFRTMYHESFLLAMQLARKAERAFQFESASRGSSNNNSYLAQAGYWDSARDGLLSAQNLFLSLKRMEMAYIENRTHDFEIVKNISLRQIDPLALLLLREAGTANFSLPEVVFDFDFPGHYFRRIKSVAVSVQCIISPYTSVNCILSLLEHRTRVLSTASGYQDQQQDDSRFRTDRIPISSIAITNGINDLGVFELNFCGERYLPFEGAGAISKWKLEFPSEVPQFDYRTITDVTLHVRYTSVSGGVPLRDAANKSVKNYLKTAELASKSQSGQGALAAIFDLKNDYPNEWSALRNGQAEVLLNIKDRLPFWTKTRVVTISTVYLAMAKPSNSWATNVKLNGAELSSAASNVPAGKKLTVLTTPSNFSHDASGAVKLNVQGSAEALVEMFMIIYYKVSDPAEG